MRCLRLGESYFPGRGRKKDVRRALALFRGVCALDYAPGCYGAAHILRFGKGPVPKNTRDAHALAVRGCNLNHGWSCITAARTFEPSAPYVEVHALMSRACELKVALGCHQMAGGLWYGLGDVPQDRGRAVTLWRLACKHNLYASCAELGIAYRYPHKGVALDQKAAAKLFERACKGRDARGCRQLGIMYANVFTTAQHLTEGIALVRRACALGLASACVDVADADLRGYGTTKSNKRALTDINKALSLDPKSARAYYQRGVIFEAMGKPTRAKADYRNALHHNPGHKETRRRLDALNAANKSSSQSRGFSRSTTAS